MNVLCLGSEIVGGELAAELVSAFLAARFDGGERYVQRLRKVAALEVNGRDEVAHDISVAIHAGMHVYDGNPGVSLERDSAIAAGARARQCQSTGARRAHGYSCRCPSPLHRRAEGTESLGLDMLIGATSVVDATAVVGDLDAEAVRSLDLPRELARVLFKTRNSQLWERGSFSRDFIRLTGSGARLLIERGVRLVGIDYLSIGDGDAHRELLGAGVIALEGLDLRGVEAGPYELVCLPLRLEGSDGAPARAILRRR